MADGSDALPNGKIGGFDKEHPEVGPGSTSDASGPAKGNKGACCCFGVSNKASGDAENDKMAHGDADRSKAVSNGDALNNGHHEPYDGELEYSPQLRRTRRQLWVWRIVSYLLIAAVIGEARSAQYV